MKKLSLLFTLVLAGQLHAQVGINNPNPEETSILELKSFKRGFLLPRMDAQRRSEIIDPALGLVVYDTDYDMLFVFNENESSGTWFGTTPFRYYTNSSTASTNNVFTDPQVGNVVIGLSSSSNTLETAAKLNVHGSLRVGEVPSASSDVPDNGLYVSGQSRLDGGLDVRGTVGTTSGGSKTSDGYYLTTFYGKGAVPVGGIIMWSGTTPPDGWALCNGSSGTPNLSGRFIVASGGGYSYGSTGGESSVTLTASEIPKHTHSVTASGTAASNGSHNHSTNSPDHYRQDDAGDDEYAGGDGRAHRASTDYDGAHVHTVTVSGTAAQQSSGGSSHENRPPFYALAFIMRIE